MRNSHNYIIYVPHNVSRNTKDISYGFYIKFQYGKDKSLQKKGSMDMPNR